ncbi:dihydrodipicolinate synthase [compost metagenome]
MLAHYAIFVHKRIVAVKDCGGYQTNILALLVSGQVDVLWGAYNQTFSTLCLDAKGTIAASTHVHPELFVTLAPMKTALALEGLTRNELRVPMPGTSEALKVRLQGVLKVLGN